MPASVLLHLCDHICFTWHLPNIYSTALPYAKIPQPTNEVQRNKYIYIYKPYINTVFSHRVTFWQTTTMSSYYSNELSRARHWVLHHSVWIWQVRVFGMSDLRLREFSICLMNLQFMMIDSWTCRNWPVLISLCCIPRCLWPPFPW